MKNSIIKKTITLSLAFLIGVTSSPGTLLSFAEDKVNELEVIEMVGNEDPVTEAPEVEAPEVEAPEVEAPEVAAPEVEAPEVEAPEVEAPEVEAPVVEDPVVEDPVVEALVVEEPVVKAMSLALNSNDTYINDIVNINDMFASGFLSEKILNLESDLSNIKELFISEGVLNLTDVNWIKGNLLNLETLKVINNARLHSLDEVNIITPNNELAMEAFDGLVHLETVEIVDLTSIGDNAFRGCTSFKTLILGSVVPNVTRTTFDDINQIDAKVVVPSGAFWDYRKVNDDVSLNDNKWFYFDIYELSNDARLTNILVDENELYPSFDRDVSDYNVNVSYDVSNITITPVMKDNTGTITINNEKVNTLEKKEIVIGEGVNTLVIRTTSEDGSQTLSTNVTITRGSEKDNIIETVAGGDFIGDGLGRNLMKLNRPAEMIYDLSGNLIFSDIGHNRIRKIDESGIASTLAGSTTSGYSGDGGYAVEASLNEPRGLVMHNNEIYFADTENNVIRKISNQGIISTVAGTGLVSSVLDGILAVESSLNKPTGVAFDKNGNLYIVDSGNNRIRKVDTYGVITTIAGEDETLNEPYGITITETDIIFFTDSGSGKIYRVRDLESNPIVDEYASGFSSPMVILTNSSNELYVTQLSGKTSFIVKIQNDRPSVVIIGDAASNNGMEVNTPFGIAIAGDEFYVSDIMSNKIIKISDSNEVSRYAGNEYDQQGDQGPALHASLNNPRGIALSDTGEMYIADTMHHVVRKVSQSGIITKYAGDYRPSNEDPQSMDPLNQPRDVALDKEGNLYIVDTENHVVKKVDTKGEMTIVIGNGSSDYTGDYGLASEASLYFPTGIDIDHEDNIYIADRYNHVIRMIDSNNVIRTIAGMNDDGDSVDGAIAKESKLDNPSDVCVDIIGNVYIVDNGNRKIKKVTLDGRITTIAGNGTVTYGNDGDLATDVGFGKIQSIDVDDIGNVYILSSFNSVIRKISPEGIISTVVGNGTNGYYGNNISAKMASLNESLGFIIDDERNIYIADSGSDRIRKVNEVSKKLTGSATLTGTGKVNDSISVNTTNNNTGNLYYRWIKDGKVFAINKESTYMPTYDDLGKSISVEVRSNEEIGFIKCDDSITVVSDVDIITTVVGGKSIGDNGLKTLATISDVGQQVRNEFSAAFDEDGNMYIADYYHNRIRKINTSGIITTIAGNGTSGYSGDGNYAVDSELSRPTSIIVDKENNIYFTDSGNNVVRKINKYGIITTVKLTMSLNSPADVAIDNEGNLFIADNGNHRILKHKVDGNTVLYAGTGQQGNNNDEESGLAIHFKLDNPQNVVVSSSGDIYINDTDGKSVRKVDTVGNLTTVLKGIEYPRGLCLTEDGILYVSDTDSNTIIKYDIKTLGRTNPIGSGNEGYSGDNDHAADASLYYPGEIILDKDGNIYFSDTGNNVIRKVDKNNIITTYAGKTRNDNGDNKSALLSTLQSSKGVVVTEDGIIYVADSGNHRVRKIDKSGIITTIAGNGIEGSFGDGVSAIEANLNNPSDLALDSKNNLYIADRGNYVVRMVNSEGIITTVAGTGENGYTGDGEQARLAKLKMPTGIYIDIYDNLYIADDSADVIRKVDVNGVITTIAGTGNQDFSGDNGPAINAELEDPRDVAIDDFGNIYIADSYNRRIRKVNKQGIITTILGNGNRNYSGDGKQAILAEVETVDSIYLDDLGRIYITDSYANVIRRIDLDGIIRTIGGTGGSGYTGDEGPATKATLSSPSKIFVDKERNIYIGDTDNHVVRKIININDRLTGTPEVTKDPVPGVQLVASLSNTNNTGTLYYKWRSGIDVVKMSTDSKYVPVSSDIGRIISVEIISDVEKVGIQLTSGLVKTSETPIDNSSPSTNTSSSVSIKISPKNFELEVPKEDGDNKYTEKTLKVSITGTSNKKVKWTSSDESIATVDENGLVKALSVGEAKITAKHVSSGNSTSSTVEVFLILDDELVALAGIFDFYEPYINGYPDSTFKPKNYVTRAEVATMFTKILKLDIDDFGTKSFNDVNENEWFYKYVQAISKTGIFKGYGDGNFKPNAPITRAEMAAVFSKVADYMDISSDDTIVPAIKDIDGTHWATKYIYEMYNAEIVKGNTDGTFGPDESTLREQVVVMINNLIGRPQLDTETTKFIDMYKEHWAFGYIEAATQLYIKTETD